MKEKNKQKHEITNDAASKKMADITKLSFFKRCLIWHKAESMGRQVRIELSIQLYRNYEMIVFSDNMTKKERHKKLAATKNKQRHLLMTMKNSCHRHHRSIFLVYCSVGISQYSLINSLHTRCAKFPCFCSYLQIHNKRK